MRTMQGFISSARGLRKRRSEVLPITGTATQACWNINGPIFAATRSCAIAGEVEVRADDLGQDKLGRRRSRCHGGARRMAREAFEALGQGQIALDGRRRGQMARLARDRSARAARPAVSAGV